MKILENDIYVSVDVEADGPNPGIHSMLSIGAAAFDINRNLLGTFERNLEVLPNAIQDEDTMINFWNEFPDQYKETRQNMVTPENGMIDFQMWLNGLKSKGKPVFAAYPSRYDMRWIDHYSWKFLETNLLGLGAIDIKTIASVVLQKSYRQTYKSVMPKRWFTSVENHTHVAIDDAIEQGELAVNIIREAYNLGPLSK